VVRHESSVVVEAEVWVVGAKQAVLVVRRATPVLSRQVVKKEKASTQMYQMRDTSLKEKRIDVWINE